MHEVPPIAIVSDLVIKSESDFEAGDRVWVKKLNKVGVVQQVQRGRRGEVEYYLLQVAGGTGLLSMIVSPLAVAKWLQP